MTEVFIFFSRNMQLTHCGAYLTLAKYVKIFEIALNTFGDTHTVC